MNASEQRSSFFVRLTEGVRVFAGDVVGGCLAIAHHSLALLGVLVVTAVALIASQPDLRQQAEARLAAWLTQQRAVVAVQAPVETEPTEPVESIEPAPVVRATAADPQTLPPAQAKLALWIARKYQVAPEPVAALVAEAYKAGQDSRIDPALILAVMAVESNFNPFAQSTAGAQGLMQVMTRVHVDKFHGYGGQFAAFDPLSNLRVGVQVLRDCIDQAGSTGGGLRCYVGATQLKTDGGYVNKVLGEYGRLQQVIAQPHQKNLVPSVIKTASTAPRPSQPPAKTSKPKPALVVVASAKTSG